ncbi:MAG: HAD-IA family hydrolase [Planctomycetaceae bacterium]|nr:HAD-IA family hydrolase [Planctomycetaceae bacterium]
MTQDNTKIRWIAFDAVGTVIFAAPSVANVYYEIGRRHGSRHDLPEVKRRFGDVFERRTNGSDHSSSESAELEFWRAVVSEVLDDVTNHEACFVELHAWFAKPEAWRCFEDVGRSLASLRAAGYRLAMASNFDERLHSVRKGMPELADVERCVVSSEVGWRKPHMGFFAALTKACGCAPEQILMIGDTWESDVLAARDAGLHAMLIDRNAGGIAPRGERNVLQSLTQLVDRCPPSDQTRIC